MLRNWLIKIFWNPFERFCLILPLIPIHSQVIEVSPGIELIRLNNSVTRFLSKFGGGFDYAVIYLIDRELFFDTGYSWARRTLEKKVFKTLDAAKIKYIINSHDHEDHTGNNAFFARKFPASKVYTHELAKLNISFPPEKPWYRRFLFGPEEACTVFSLPESIELQSKRTIEVFHTPGHTDGHICLYDPKNKILFTGDLFISEDLDTQLEEADGPSWIKSLEMISSMDVQLILDGHGVVISGDECRKKLQLKLEFLKTLRSKVFEIAARGEINQADLIRMLNSSPGIVNFLSQGEGWMSLITDGNFSRSNLIRGFLKEFLKNKISS